MSVLFAIWCVASGLYTGFLLVRKGLNRFRKVTNKIKTLNDNLKTANTVVPEDIVIKNVVDQPIEVKENV